MLLTKLDETFRKSAVCLNKAARYIDNSTKILKYWNPLDDAERHQIRGEVEKIKQQKSRLIKKYIILWISMILITIVVCLIL